MLSQLEYRFNLFTDAVIQPILTGGIEVALWSAIFAGSGQATIGSYPKESYLAYALWAAFFGRISSNWMYEFRMIDEIETGTVNSVLARPISFYEYYLSQFMGYKVLTSLLSLIVPFSLTLAISGPTIHARLPAAFLLACFYLVLVHTISFSIASFAFFFNRVHAFTVAKNIALWFLTGELFPLDLVPEPYRHYLLNLPFASGVYIPIGYLTGRLGDAELLRAFGTVALSLVIAGPLTAMLWLAGRRQYSGTGA